MKGKVTGVLLVILNLLLLGGLGFFYFQQDKEAPKMEAEEVALVYENGMEEAKLMEGVTAFDNEDGDITSQIVIEKIVTDSEKESATITYGVVDSSGNISKVTRTVDMIVEEVAEEVEPETEEEISEETSEESSEELSEEESEEENTTEAAEESSKNPVTESKKPEDNKTSQTNKKPEQNKPAAAQTTKPAPQPANQNNNSRPSILFRDTTVKASVGGNPAWVNAIEGLYDDKDDYMALFGTLKVYGDYDRNTPGTYKVKVTVTDSDGNESASYPVDIVIQ